MHRHKRQRSTNHYHPSYVTIHKKSYFELLSEKELCHIIRHLSARPRCSDWVGNVAPINALSVLHSDTHLASTARRVFRHLSMKNTTSFKRALAVTMGYEKGAYLFEALLAALGPTMNGLYLGPSFQFPDSLRSWRYGDNLRCLHANYTMDMCHFRPILEVCSGNLRELAISGCFLDADNINAIGEHTRGLTKFDLRYKGFASALDAIWKTVGPTLEDLTLHVEREVYAYREHLIDGITAHCTQVKSFSYDGMNTKRKSILLCLCEKFGPGLKTLKFRVHTRCPSRAKIRKILKACPDLVIDVRLLPDQGKILEAARDRIHAVEFNSGLDGDVERTGKAVPSLERLSVIVAYESLHFLPRFLSSPKPLLKSLHLDVLRHECFLKLDDNPLDIVARHIASIEVLSVVTIRFDPRVFRAFAITNQRLKRVAISCEVEEVGAYMVVQDFSQCPLLEELVLDMNNSASMNMPFNIAQACDAFRGRSVDIFIGGRQYFC